MSGARQQEKLETDAEPFDKPQSAGRGSSVRRGRTRRQPSSHHVSAQGMDTALSFLPQRDRADVEQAIRDAEQAVMSVKHLSGSGSKSKSMPSFAVPGGVNIQNFNNCENIHIGETHVVTNHNYGHDGSNWKPEQAKPQEIDENIRRLLVSSTPLTTSHVTSLADNVGSVWRRLGRALGLQDGQLDNYRHDYMPEGQHEVTYQMIRGWVKKAGDNATVGAMVKALVSVRRLDIARSVFVNTC